MAGVRFPARAKLFLFFTVFILALEPTQPHMQGVKVTTHLCLGWVALESFWMTRREEKYCPCWY
jgi:hypothetical protein